MRFLLSIHDVWPGNFPLVAGYLQRLRSMGATRAALLIVPHYHGHSPMEESREFLAWLQEEIAAGTEVFLHGYRHWMPELAEASNLAGKRNAWGHWVNRRWVAQEAEFCGLSEADRDHLLELGASAFRKSKLDCIGFVAPTWYGSPSQKSLLQQGFRIQETRFFIRHLQSGRARLAPPLAWDLSRGGEPMLFGGMVWLQTLLRLPLIKVAIHPGDLAGHEVLNTIEQVIQRGTGSNCVEIFERIQKQPR